MRWTAVLPVLSLVLGWVLSQWGERVRYQKERRDNIAEALRAQRAEAYRKFMRSAHSSAHLTGRASAACPVPLTGDRELALSSVDREVAADLYELELFANEPTLKAARSVRKELTAFREVVMSGAEYMSDEYRAVLGVYQRARTEFLSVARTELLSAHLGAK